MQSIDKENNKLSINQLIKNCLEDSNKKTKLIQQEKNILDQLCNSLINPIIRYHEESMKELEKHEAKYVQFASKVLAERNNI